MEPGTSKVLWSEDERILRQSSNGGVDVIYLWKDGLPVAAKYLTEIAKISNKTADELSAASDKTQDDRFWYFIAESMEFEKDVYLTRIDRLQSLLDLDRTDATILSLHFTGMGPGAISMKLGLPLYSVRDSFDRIMEAYTQKGIVVNDSIFTEDPFSMYEV